MRHRHHAGPRARPDRMLQPEAVAAYVEEYQRTLASQRQQQGKERRRLEKKAVEAGGASRG